MSDPEGGRAPGRPRRPRVDLRGPREGVRALRRFAPKRKIHPATGAAAPAGGPPLMSHGRGARLPSWSDTFGSLAPKNSTKT